MTSDFHKKTLGVLRIRQHRTRKDCCSVNERMAFLKIDCLSTYNSCPDYNHYGLQWGELKHFERLTRFAKSWLYNLPPKEGPQPYEGTNLIT